LVIVFKNVINMVKFVSRFNSCPAKQKQN